MPEQTGERIYTISGRGFSATCDAFVVNQHAETIWFASMIGSRQAIRAISANLMTLPAQRVFLNSDDPGDGYHAFTPAEATRKNWTSRIQRLPNSSIYHGMTYSQTLEYNGDENQFVLITRPHQEEADLYYRFLNRRLTIPLHPEWSQWLWQAGQDYQEIIPLEAHGVSASYCIVSQPSIKKRISEAIQAGQLRTEQPPDEQAPDEQAPDEQAPDEQAPDE